MARHRIQRQYFDLTLSRRLPGPEVQEAVRRLFWEEALPALDRLFTELAGDETVYRFDRLEIDLGTLSRANLEMILVERLEVEIQKTLRARMAGAERDGDIRKLPAELEDVEVFLHVLKMGAYPWYFSSGEGQELQSLARRVMDRSPAVLLRGLHALPAKVTAQRLALQFEEPMLTQFLKLLTPPALRGFDDHFSILRGLVRRLHREAGITNSWLRAMWNQAFLGLLQGPNTFEELTLGLFRLLDQLEGGGGTSWRKLLDRSLSPAHPLHPLSKKSTTEMPPSPGGITAGSPVPGPAHPEGEPPGQTGIRETGLFIRNAGLVLLAPFLGTFFRKVGLIKDRDFVSETARERAVLLTHYLMGGLFPVEEPYLLLNKLLCGYNLEQPVSRRIEVSKVEEHESMDLLQSVIGHWEALGRTSVSGFREAFLQREGKLRQEPGRDFLLVERRSFDLLLEKLPWNIRLIKLSWMPVPLEVEW